MSMSMSMGFNKEVLTVFMLTQLPESWKMTSQSIANSFGEGKVELPTGCERDHDRIDQVV